MITVERPRPRDLTPDQRHDILDWLELMAIPNRSVESVELDLVDMPIVRVTRFVRDEDGRHVLTGGGYEVARDVTEHAVVRRPPEWWQPVTRAAATRQHQLATGGRIPPGGLRIVGERGPELPR